MTLWDYEDEIDAVKYKCSYCEKIVGSDKGWVSTPNRFNNKMKTCICPYCHKITFFDYDRNQFPSPIYGNDVGHLPKDIEELYNEARKCTQVNAFTSSVMACRKLLMNVAVSKGAKKRLTFEGYVDYLDKIGYVPPDGKTWVNHIRKQGNEANHEITLKNKEDAIELINFIEMLLKFIYEFPSKMKAKKV